jgi:hypothetical protein
LRSLAEISSDRFFLKNLLIKIEFLSLNNNYNKINENTHKFEKQKHDRKGSTWQKSEAFLAAAVFERRRREGGERVRAARGEECSTKVN